MHRERGFTLVEIMIVVAIIALLAAIALPSFLRARERARRTIFISALRVARDACDTYVIEHNGWPPDVNRGTLPAGMATYFNAHFDWTASTPIGGHWDWDYKVFGFTAGVSVIDPNETPEEMAEIDAMIDDGDLSSGAFQQTASGRYTWILE
ncbi:MAG TPA: type II secretion system protein [Chthoniobacterales bacterium]|jgi:type IV pilus assembly protein PilA|nr:type II secretion system protein [Chthoniobacterales bacterium]